MTCRHCGEALDANEECPRCEAERAASLADFLAHGGYHPNTRPLEPHERTWVSRDELMRRAAQED